MAPLIALLPTLRLLYLLLLGAPLWLLALLFPAGWLIGLFYLLLMIALCWRDAGTIPPAAKLIAERRLPPRFALDVEQAVAPRPADQRQVQRREVLGEDRDDVDAQRHRATPSALRRARAGRR